MERKGYPGKRLEELCEPDRYTVSVIVDMLDAENELAQGEAGRFTLCEDREIGRCTRVVSRAPRLRAPALLSSSNSSGRNGVRWSLMSIVYSRGDRLKLQSAAPIANKPEKLCFERIVGIPDEGPGTTASSGFLRRASSAHDPSGTRDAWDQPSRAHRGKTA